MCTLAPSLVAWSLQLSGRGRETGAGPISGLRGCGPAEPGGCEGRAALLQGAVRGEPAPRASETPVLFSQMKWEHLRSGGSLLRAAPSTSRTPAPWGILPPPLQRPALLALCFCPRAAGAGFPFCLEQMFAHTQTAPPHFPFA